MKILVIIVLLLLTVGSVSAQEEDTLPVGAVAERVIKASTSVTDFRGPGDLRVWQFYAKQTTFGQLTSLAREMTEIDGEPALVLHESLHLDYTLIDADQKITVSGETFVSSEGKYLGHALELGAGEAVDKFEVQRDGESLEGFYTRGGAEQSISLPYKTDAFFWDLHFLDQLEIYLAMQDLEIGTRLDDSIYLPQSLMKTHLSGQVIYFMWQEIYKGKIDSVFIIRLQEPSEVQLYFTPDKKLVRADLVNQNIRVYQDVVRQLAPKKEAAATAPVSPTAPGLSMRGLLFKLPHYLAYLLIAALAMALVSIRAFRWGASYLCLVVGMLLYLIMPLVANRILVAITQNWLGPAMAEGGSLYVLGAVPPIFLGFVHALLLILGINLMIQWLKPREYRWVALGGFLGVGFALAEAAYVSGMWVTPLFDWPLAERAASLFLYAFTGALLGRALTGDKAKPGPVLLVVVAVIGLVRYLPVLVQTKLVDVQAMYFILIILVVIYVFAGLSYLKKPINREIDAEVAPEAD